MNKMPNKILIISAMLFLLIFMNSVFAVAQSLDNVSAVIDATYITDQNNKKQIEGINSTINYNKDANYSFVEYPFDISDKKSIESANSIVWEKTGEYWRAYKLIYDVDRNINSYGLLTNGFYFIDWNGKSCYYAFDKVGNMVTGYVMSKNKIYCMLPNGLFEGAMLNNTADIYGVKYLFAEDGNMISSISTFPTFIYDMDYGQYRFLMLNSNGLGYASNTMIDFRDRYDRVRSYFFDSQGYMRTGLIFYNNQLYYASEIGDSYGQVYKGEVSAISMHDKKVATFYFGNDNSLSKIVIK